MGKRTTNFEKNGSHLTGYNAKVAELKEKDNQMKDNMKQEFLKKMQTIQSKKTDSSEK